MKHALLLWITAHTHYAQCKPRHKEHQEANQIGIDESLIIEENKSTNTNENIIYSKKIIETSPTEDYEVVIITNGFHCYRSKLLANKHGLEAHTYAARENLDTAPHYYLREFFGCLKDMILS